jgi:SAM-dependent methyltransferase
MKESTNFKIDDKSYKRIRRLDSRIKSKKYYWFYKLINNILDKSDDFWILNLRDNNPPLYLLAKNDTRFSYEEIQTEANVRKLHNSSEDSLYIPINACVEYLKLNLNKKYIGICHGVRNGIEVKLFNNLLNEDNPSYKIIGTDISYTASNFKNVIQWDFHLIKEEFINKFDFIYSNSLDQSNNPEKALNAWLDCLKVDGLLFVDLGKGGKSHWALLDPFCCEPEFFPMVVLKFLKGKGCVCDIIQKNTNDHRNLIFVIKKL